MGISSHAILQIRKIYVFELERRYLSNRLQNKLLDKSERIVSEQNKKISIYRI